MPKDYKNEIIIDYEDVSDQSLFSAKPAYIEDDTDQKFEEILKSAYQSNDIAPLNQNIDNGIAPLNQNTDNRITPLIQNVDEESEQLPISVENSLSASSMEDSIKIYNVQTGEIVQCKPEDKVSARYDTDQNDNIDIADKNSPEDDRLSEVSDVEDVVFINGLEESDHKSEEEVETSDISIQLPSVKELAKKFISMESLSEPIKPTQNVMRRQKSKENMLDIDKPVSKSMYMHSLTARSISREFREELKLSMATPLTIPGGSKEIPEGTEEISKESSRPGSPLPEPGHLKSKLAFFESLKSKFSK